MRSLLILAFFCFSFYGQSQQSNSSNSFTIKGQFDEDLNGRAVLKYGRLELKEKVRDGKFNFTGHIKYPQAAVITFKGKKTQSFYIENNTIVIRLKESLKTGYNGSKKEIWEIVSIKGSQTQSLSEDFNSFYKSNRSLKNFKHILFNYLDKKISKYPDNPFYYPIVYQYARRQELMSHAQIIRLIDKMDLVYLSEKQRFNLLKILERNNRYSVGKMFPDEELELQNGKQNRIYSKLGKITLIDFWASWCMPCRKKNPEIKELYNKFHSKGFNVIGISTDRDQKKWKLAIKKDDLPWTNFNTNTFNRKMQISSIPYTYLLNQNGKIIGINLSQNELKDILRKEL